MFDDLFLEHRAEGSGIRAHGVFLPFLKDDDPPPDVIVCVPWEFSLVFGAVKQNCAKCGREISVAPSSVMLLRQHPGIPTCCVYCVIAERGQCDREDSAI
jgi:hypothetical protein